MWEVSIERKNCSIMRYGGGICQADDGILTGLSGNALGASYLHGHEGIAKVCCAGSRWIACGGRKRLYPGGALLPVGRTLLLNESGVMKWSNVRNISKYQLAENVYKAILGEYMSIEDKPFPKLITDSDTKLIGFYSPVHRSMQTLIALTVGQVLAQKHRTLYLNLEFCAGSKEFLSDGQVRDITDLMYFLNTDKEKIFSAAADHDPEKRRVGIYPSCQDGRALAGDQRGGVAGVLKPYQFLRRI